MGLVLLLGLSVAAGAAGGCRAGGGVGGPGAGETGSGGAGGSGPAVVARYEIPPSMGGFTRLFSLARGDGPGEVAPEQPGGGPDLDLAIGADGQEFFVLDAARGRVQRYGPGGDYLGSIDVSGAVEAARILPLADGGLLVHDVVGRAAIHLSPAGEVLATTSLTGVGEDGGRSRFGYGPGGEPYLFLSGAGDAWWSVPLGAAPGKSGSGGVAGATAGLVYPLGGTMAVAKSGKLYTLETPGYKVEFTGGPFTTAGTGTGGGITITAAGMDGTVYLEVIYVAPASDVETAQYLVGLDKDGRLIGSCLAPGCLDIEVTGGGRIFGLCRLDAETLEIVELELGQE